MRLINLSDELCEWLSAMKNLPGLLVRNEAKAYALQDVLNQTKEQDKSFKGKRVKIDYDRIAYGASRESP
jgi:hypothetical protein